MNTRHEIRKLWHTREAQQRTGEEAIRLADDAWAQGLRLSRHQHTYYQLVMDLVRRDIRA
ncbi:hypothetical protein KCQ_05216 [Pectobacterium atrosepticum ICMP 1526]|uniref:hypothetical protein n=1 Tax=Pectobacterium atrosepticum TaxID=29471 RepID=UPI0005050ABD|nr:hypothetical protein [Pectobacterium atrosepticum]KFX11056.1 hypothetical protein JV34_21675 [Pectobacterium atrosepticum]KMK87613.1 hypothetical protein KCQ_05216 [Pectobacterium atrosepticum ICMP 1526]QXE13101.1 hypothetical protein DCX48_00495 [Pectobacterium atrosepticum]